MSLITLKNKFDCAGSRDILVLGCGPSLNDFNEAQLNAAAYYNGDKLVICIKQSIFKFPWADIHVNNTCNLSGYTEIYKENNIHSVFECSYIEMPYYNLSKWDTILPILSNNDFTQSISYTKEIEKWSFDNSPNVRQWGPGIFFEVVLPLCEYLKCNGVYTIGVDLGFNNSPREHFYKDEYRIYNKARPLEENETKMEIELSKLFYEWLQSKDINWFVCNKNSNVHEIVPRKEL